MKYLSSLCASSLEGRARCSRNTEPSQAFRKAVWASAGERESSIPPTIILCWRHQTLLYFPVSVALGFSAVFYVTAPLPPEARTLLAAQMVQRRCPLSWAWNTHTGGYCRAQCVFVGKVSSDYCQVLSVTSETFDLLHMCQCPSVKLRFFLSDYESVCVWGKPIHYSEWDDHLWQCSDLQRLSYQVPPAVTPNPCSSCTKPVKLTTLWSVELLQLIDGS